MFYFSITTVNYVFQMSLSVPTCTRDLLRNGNQTAANALKWYCFSQPLVFSEIILRMIYNINTVFFLFYSTVNILPITSNRNDIIPSLLLLLLQSYNIVQCSTCNLHKQFPLGDKNVDLLAHFSPIEKYDQILYKCSSLFSVGIITANGFSFKWGNARIQPAQKFNQFSLNFFQQILLLLLFSKKLRYKIVSFEFTQVYLVGSKVATFKQNTL